MASFGSAVDRGAHHEGESVRWSRPILIGILSLITLSAAADPSLPDGTLECWYWGKAYDAVSKTYRQQRLRSNMESLTLRPDGIFETGVEVRAKYDYDAHKRLIRLRGRLYEGIIGYITSDSRGDLKISFFFAENAEAPAAQSRDVPAIDPGDTICTVGQP